MGKSDADFGFQKVKAEEKEKMVQQVFSSVANKYDLMNDLMSFGLHKAWKKTLIQAINPAGYEALLDVAGGTGDVARAFLDSGGKSATVADLNENMLLEGRNKHVGSTINWVHSNAECLPFADNQFDICTISFGIRNVTNINIALKEMFRVLKPGGRFFCLEFSSVNMPILKQIYDIYSFKVIPKIGQIVANDQKAYEYLVQSIKMFPNAVKFASMIEDAGFCDITYQKLTFGVVAIHQGAKHE